MGKKPTQKQKARTPARDGDMARYRVLAACRIGHFREAGDVFTHPRFDPCPEHLQELDVHEGAGDMPALAVTMPPVDQENNNAPGVTPADLLGEM